MKFRLLIVGSNNFINVLKEQLNQQSFAHHIEVADANSANNAWYALTDNRYDLLVTDGENAFHEVKDFNSFCQAAIQKSMKVLYWTVLPETEFNLLPNIEWYLHQSSDASDAATLIQEILNTISPFAWNSLNQSTAALYQSFFIKRAAYLILRDATFTINPWDTENTHKLQMIFQLWTTPLYFNWWYMAAAVARSYMASEVMGNQQLQPADKWPLYHMLLSTYQETQEAYFIQHAAKAYQVSANLDYRIKDLISGDRVTEIASIAIWMDSQKALARFQYRRALYGFFKLVPFGFQSEAHQSIAAKLWEENFKPDREMFPANSIDKRLKLGKQICEANTFKCENGDIVYCSLLEKAAMIQMLFCSREELKNTSFSLIGGRILAGDNKIKKTILYQQVLGVFQ